jgi:hypothetical protein
MFTPKKWFSRSLIGGVVLITTGAASAAVNKVICVPWQGDVNKQHTAISGQAAQLKCVVKTSDTSAVYVKWAFGDGSADSVVTTLSGATKYNVETTHTYTAAKDTPFTAKLQVSDTTPFAMSKEDPFLLKIQADEVNARINVAIDKGLWWLYKSGNNHSYVSSAHTYDNSPAVTWVQTSWVFTLATPTASAVHAFGINGHRAHGNPDQDPYVEAVVGGMNYLTKGYYNTATYPALQAVNISANKSNAGHVADEPDANGNGYGIQFFDQSSGNHVPYQTGQIMDAIIASGVLPSDSTGRDFAPGTPASHIWTYQELLQDMADMHAWGQNDSGTCAGGICGSWWYGWNYGSYGDNSASQWGAIGMMPSQEAPWNVVVPNWVKSYNANWIEYSRCSSGSYLGSFGYNNPCSCAGDLCLATTTSAMVQMIFVGQNTGNPKWEPAQKFVADRWRTFMQDGSTWGGSKTYGWYSFAKAMRLAKPAPVAQLVKTSGISFDWYYGNSANAACTTEANCEKGLAPRILETQTASGANTGAWEVGQMTEAPMTTAWMIITLRPTLFAAAPIACFTVTPNPSYADLPISFNPSCSGHSESGKDIKNLTQFEWDWDNDGVYDTSSATPSTATHPFACANLPCTYPVTLRVTDDNNPALSATTVVNVNITEPPHPPVADAGGPYMVSMCPGDSLLLNGSASLDQDQGQHETGCATCENDTITAYAWDLVAPLTFDAVNKTGVTPSLVAAEIASLLHVGSQDIGLRVTDNTALAYPASGQPNLTNADFGNVDVKSACMCDLAARPKSGKVQLTWAPVAGAASYDIYRSTVGANAGFVKIAAGVVTTYATYLDSAAVNGTKYYYRAVANTGCGSSAVSATAGGR